MDFFIYVSMYLCVYSGNIETARVVDVVAHRPLSPNLVHSSDPHSRTRCRADKIPMVFMSPLPHEIRASILPHVLPASSLTAATSNSFKHSPRWSYDKLLPKLSGNMARTSGFTGPYAR